MSLKNWMKKIETAQLNEFAPPTGSVMVPGMQGQGQVDPTFITPTKPNDKATQGILAALAKNKNIAVVTQPGQTQTDADTTNTSTGGTTTQTVGGTTQVSETGLDQVNSLHDQIQVESKPRKEISDGLRYIKDNYKHECKMYEDGWGLDESMYSALVDHYYHEGKIPRSLMIEGGQALREFIEGCYAKDTMVLGEDEIDEVTRVNPGQPHDSLDTLRAPVTHVDSPGTITPARLASADRESRMRGPSTFDRVKGAVGKLANKLGGPGYEELRTRPPSPLDEEMSPLERSLRQSTKEKEMFENKKTRSVQEATEKTKTGLRHKADSGGYGRVDDEEDTDEDGKKIKKVKKDEPKKGRGRPKKTDNASGEDKKFDFSAFGVNHGKDIKLKPWDKKKTTVKKIATKADREEVDEAYPSDEAKNKGKPTKKPVTPFTTPVKETLKGRQKKIDINKNGKIDGGDFAMLRGQKKKDAQMESWERQLNGLLTEGMSVSTSTGQAGGEDSVSITATAVDAGKLLQILQNAGLSGGAPAQASTNTTSPSTGSSGGSAANADLNGSGSAVTSMPMPRGMAFSVQPAETNMPTAPVEVNVSDSEEVFNQLGKDHGQSEKSDNGDDALSFLKKAIGHSTEYADGKSASTTDSNPAQEETEEVEENDEDGKKPDEDGDGVPDWADKKPGKDDSEESDTEEESEEEPEEDDSEDEEEKVDEGKETCNECGGLMEDDHQCETQLNEWSNSPQGQSVDEQFKTDLEFMQNIISGGLNKKKEDQTVMPHTKVKVTESKVKNTASAYTLELKKLAGI